METQEKSTHQAIVVPVNMICHENANSLSVVRIFDSYTCVVRTEDWLGVDKAIYLVPDSLVDVTRPEFNFLLSDARYDKDSNPITNGTYARIKAKKLRGIQSYGLLVPAPKEAILGEDYYDRLGVQRYEPPIKVSGGGCGFSFGGEVSAPPKLGYDAPKYDVDSFMIYGKTCFVEGEPLWITLKYHGSCSKYCYKDGQFHCGSRAEWKREYPSQPIMTDEARKQIIEKNPETGEAKVAELEAKFANWKPSKNLWWVALEQDKVLQEFLKSHEEYVVYGELVGVQGNNFRYGCKPGQYKIFVFDIMKNGRWLDAREARDLAPELNWVHIFHKDFPFNFDKLVSMVENMPVIINKPEEGFVIKPLKERWHEKAGRVQFKLINPKYSEKDFD